MLNSKNIFKKSAIKPQTIKTKMTLKKESTKALKCFVLMSSFILFGSNLQAETLIEVYQQAQKNDHTFRAAIATYEAGLENKNIGRSALLPQISGTASLSDYNQEQRLNGPAFIDPSNPTANNDGTIDTDGTTYTLSLSQTIFDLATWHDYKNSKAIADIAEATFTDEKQNLILRVSQAYFDTLEATENLSTSIAQEAALEKQLEQAKQRFEVGLIAITEVHEAQAAFDSARADKINAQGAVGIAFDALEVLTGRPYSNIAPFKEAFPVVAPQPQERQAWIDMALKNNPNLIAQALSADAAKETANARKADHYPTVDASISYSDAESDGLINDAESNTQTEETSISLTLNVPIFSGFRTSAARRQANQQSIAARETYLQVQRDTVQSARSFHLSVLTGVANVEARKQAIISSTSAYEATKAGYDVGTRDLVDVLNAQRSVFQAERDHDTALYDYLINALNLKATAGTLNEKDLVELDNWLNEAQVVTRTN